MEFSMIAAIKDAGEGFIAPAVTQFSRTETARTKEAQQLLNAALAPECGTGGRGIRRGGGNGGRLCGVGISKRVPLRCPPDDGKPVYMKMCPIRTHK